jgi:hypothetical protein
MFQIRNAIPRQNDGGATPASVQNRRDRSATSASRSNSPRQDHGRLNENGSVANSPVSASHHHHDNLLHMRLRGLGDPRHNAKLHGDCVICTEAFAVHDVVCQLPCRHIYHSTCILQWLDTSQLGTCPTCRQHISDTPSTAAGGIGEPDDVADEDGYFGYNTSRHCKPMFQKRQNFDLIMRRVLRAREEHRVLSQVANKDDYPSRIHDHDGGYESSDDNVEDQEAAIVVQPLKKIVFHDTTRKLASSDHTRRTSICSSSAGQCDWLVDDLEEFLNIVVNEH